MKKSKLEKLEEELVEIEGWLVLRQEAMIEGTASERTRVEWRAHIVKLNNVSRRIVRLGSKSGKD